MKSFWALAVGIAFAFTPIILHFAGLHNFNNFYEYKGIYEISLREAINLQESHGRYSVDIISIDDNKTIVSLNIYTDRKRIGTIEGIIGSRQLIKNFSYVISSIGMILLIIGSIGLAKFQPKDEVGTWRHNRTCGHCGYIKTKIYHKDIKLQQVIKCPTCGKGKFYLMY
jgi:hypothetical protein